MHALSAPLWKLVQDPVKISSGLSSLILCSANSSCLGLARLSFISLTQVVCGTPPRFLTLCCGLEMIITGLTLFVFHISGTTVIHCVISRIFRNILSYILSYISGWFFFFFFQLERAWGQSPSYLSKVLLTLTKFPKRFDFTQESNLSGHDMVLIHS